jgi:hypothetical protein
MMIQFTSIENKNKNQFFKQLKNISNLWLKFDILSNLLKALRNSKLS